MTVRRLVRTTLVPLALVAATVASLVAPALAAGTLYGLTSSDGGDVYTIDEATGAATHVAMLTGTGGTSFVGLEFLRGVLYATDVVPPGGDQFSFSFGTIDPSTGAFTVINNQGGSLNWHGLAANESANLLYIIDLDDSNNLKTVTPAGVITTIGPAEIDGRGMAYDDTHGILYATGGGSLYTVDTTAGASTLVGSMGISNNRIGLAYDEVGGVLYANNADTGSLYTLDVTTGAAALVGANGATTGFGIDGLAWLAPPATVPMPPSIALLVGGALICLARGRGRH